MNKAYLINSSMAALATAFIFTASLSSADAGWGPNGMYGNPPAQTQTRPKPQTRPAQLPTQTGGYGGGQSRPTGGWTGGRPVDAYGTASQQTNSYPDRRPCRRCDRPYIPAPTYNDRPTPGGAYLPKRDGTYVYVPPRPVYVPQHETYNNGYGGSVTYNNGGGYQGPKPNTWSNGGGYGGSQSSPTNNWGGYGGSR
jgi:hypothetical protein